MSKIERKPVAWILTILSVVLLVRNLLEMDGPTNQPLGAICLFGAIAGCFWLWHIKKEDDRDRRNFRQDQKRRDGNIN
jgi:hypothetical protein